MSRLYSSFTSPYASKVRMVAALLGHPLELLDGHAERAALLAVNPLGKVPTLLLDDGTAVFDSVVIVETLLAQHGDERLVPPALRLAVRRWEAIADGVCDLLIPAIMERRKPDGARDDASVTAALARVRAVLERVDAETGSRAPLLGEQLTLADLAWLSALGYVKLRAPELLSGLAGLAAFTTATLAAEPQLAELTPAVRS